MKESEKVLLIEYRRDKAFDTLNEIQILLDNKLFSTAMNRIYYAGFYIASALVLFDDFSTSKHKQLIGFFNNKYIRTNLIDFKSGEILNKSFQKRSLADYGDFIIVSEMETVEYYRRITEFVKEVDRIIQNRLQALKNNGS